MCHFLDMFTTFLEFHMFHVFSWASFLSLTIKSIVTSPKPSSSRANMLSDYSYPIPATKQPSRAFPFINPPSHLSAVLSCALLSPLTIITPWSPQNSTTPPRKHRFAVDIAYFRRFSCVFDRDVFSSEIVASDVILRKYGT